MSGVITGSKGRKEKLSEAVFGTMRSRQGTYCHVAKSPRRDIGSTMQKSTTSPRRDVSSKICISSLNARRLGNEGIGRRTTRDTDLQSQRIQTSRDFPGFVPFSILLYIIEDIMRMFLILDILFFSFMMF